MSMPKTTIQERLAWSPNPETHDKIKRLWMKHSIAEDRRDLQGLVDTLTEDCVYELVPTGQFWHGHEGARAFYTSMLTAFPDVHFALNEIVIGPQGVIEVADVTGTHQGAWAGIAPTGKAVQFQVIIYFPWNPVAEKFAGERMWFDQTSLSLGS